MALVPPQAVPPQAVGWVPRQAMPTEESVALVPPQAVPPQAVGPVPRQAMPAEELASVGRHIVEALLPECLW